MADISPKFYLNLLPGVYLLIKTDEKDKLWRPILNALLSNNLFSITCSAEETSIMLRFDNQHQLMLESENTYLDPTHYSCLEVNTAQPALEETGMLAEVTAFFAQHGIPILCLSTYSCNYIYYPLQFRDQLNQAIEENPIFQFEWYFFAV